MTTWRYVPDAMLTVVATNPIRGQNSPVVSRRFIPISARQQGDGCIRQDMGMLVLTMANGHKAHYGFDGAQITSDLRMVVTRTEWTDDPKSCGDEVIRNQWPIATEL